MKQLTKLFSKVHRVSEVTKDPNLRYTLHELNKELYLAEKHAKQGLLKSGKERTDVGFCLSCLNKHLSAIEGLSEEGIGFTKDELLRSQFKNLYNYTRKLNTDLSGHSDFSIVADELRKNRLKLSLIPAIQALKPNREDLFRRVTEYISQKHGLRMPELYFKACPDKSGRACLMHNGVNQIYVDPSMGIRALLHELGHYVNHQKYGEMKGADEGLAEAFADNALRELESVGLARKRILLNERVINRLRSENMVVEALDRAYDWLVGPTKVSAADLNEAWTPEIIGSLTEAGLDTVATRLGTAIAGLVTGGVTAAVATHPRVNPRDKKFLHEFGAHMATRILDTLSPTEMSLLATQARDFGRALSPFDVEGVKRTLFKSTEEIRLNFDRLRATFEAITAPPVPVPVAPPATVPPVVPPPPGVPPIEESEIIPPVEG